MGTGGTSLLILSLRPYALSLSCPGRTARREARAGHASLRPAFSLSLLFKIPLPVQRLSIFSVFRKSRARQCSTFLLARGPRSRKSTASVQGEGKRAWRARGRAVATPFASAVATLPSRQPFA